MSINSVTAMDVDSPSTTTTGTSGGSLKRSSSAPMINDINNTNMTTSPTINNSTARENNNTNLNVFSSVQSRPRRFSASFSPIAGSSSPGLRLTPRISQLRQEECVEREVAHERDIHCQMQMSQSCEDLTLVTESPGSKSDSELRTTVKDYSKMAPLQLSLNTAYTPLCSSPSPTRPGFQPYSPMIWKTQSPSPSRKQQTYLTRRSCSPIAMRQSQLGPVKRKLDDDKLDIYLSPRVKRFNSYNPSNDRGGLLMAHNQNNSNSNNINNNNNNNNNTSSPLPGSLSSVGTPESLSSADSPGFTFRPVDSPSPNRPMQSTGDEPMNEDRSAQASPSKLDQIMTTVDQDPS